MRSIFILASILLVQGCSQPQPENAIRSGDSEEEALGARAFPVGKIAGERIMKLQPGATRSEVERLIGLPAEGHYTFFALGDDPANANYYREAYPVYLKFENDPFRKTGYYYVCLVFEKRPEGDVLVENLGISEPE